MKPSNQPGEALILNTVPECKVVLDAIEDPNFPKPVEQANAELRDHFAFRFRLQTQHEPRPPFANAYVEPVWNTRPEFRVRTDDAPFVLRASKRILGQRSFSDRLFNLLSGRTNAAKNLVKTLSS